MTDAEMRLEERIMLLSSSSPVLRSSVPSPKLQALQVRSQSESAALNRINGIRGLPNKNNPYDWSDAMCRHHHLLQQPHQPGCGCGGRFGNVSYSFAPVQEFENPMQSDSEGDDSFVSPSSSSSSDNDSEGSFTPQADCESGFRDLLTGHFRQQQPAEQEGGDTSLIEPLAKLDLQQQEHHLERAPNNDIEIHVEEVADAENDDDDDLGLGCELELDEPSGCSSLLPVCQETSLLPYHPPTVSLPYQFSSAVASPIPVISVSPAAAAAAAAAAGGGGGEKEGLVETHSFKVGTSPIDLCSHPTPFPSPADGPTIGLGWRPQQSSSLDVSPPTPPEVSDTISTQFEPPTEPLQQQLSPFGEETPPTPAQQRIAELVAEECALRYEAEERERERLSSNGALGDGSEKEKGKGKKKKHVQFADECGHCLETIRVMTEPSDYPPKISAAVIRRYRKAAAAAAAAAAATSLAGRDGALPTVEDADDEEEEDEKEDSSTRSTWKIGFKQPASEYVKFRDTLDHQKVALENVMLKNETGRMAGTIKVANISFEKRVFLRYTFDGWKSHLDRDAKFQASLSKAFDTFRFDIEIPKNTDKDSRLEFCVCFVAGDKDEFWDSNEGKNYHLVSPQPEPPLEAPSSARTDKFPNGRLNGSSTYPPGSKHRAAYSSYSWDADDAYRFEYKDWTGFGSWKQLSTQGPYW